MASAFTDSKGEPTKLSLQVGELLRSGRHYEIGKVLDEYMKSNRVMEVEISIKKFPATMPMEYVKSMLELFEDETKVKFKLVV